MISVGPRPLARNRPVAARAGRRAAGAASIRVGTVPGATGRGGRTEQAASESWQVKSRRSAPAPAIPVCGQEYTVYVQYVQARVFGPPGLGGCTATAGAQSPGPGRVSRIAVALQRLYASFQAHGRASDAS